MAGEINCVDIVTPFVDVLDACRNTVADVQLFGGIGSFALGDARVEIVPDEKLIIAPAGLYLPNRREDNTLRDLDCLVLSPLQHEVDDVESLAKVVIPKGALDSSVFGFRSLKQLERQRRYPVLAGPKVHVSDRYVIMDGERVAYAKKGLFPFAVDLPVATLETWQMQIGDDSDLRFPVPHPGASVLNYLTRSRSGLRPKDEPKVHTLTKNLAEKWPDLMDWIVDGDGASQFEFARVLHTLREPAEGARSLYVGGILPVEPYALDSLTTHDAFMYSGEAEWHTKLVAAEHAASSILFMFEKRPRMVTAWQKHVEPRIQGILKNK